MLIISTQHAHHQHIYTVYRVAGEHFSSRWQLHEQVSSVIIVMTTWKMRGSKQPKQVKM